MAVSPKMSDRLRPLSLVEIEVAPDLRSIAAEPQDSVALDPLVSVALGGPTTATASALDPSQEMRGIDNMTRWQ